MKKNYNIKVIYYKMLVNYHTISGSLIQLLINSYGIHFYFQCPIFIIQNINSRDILTLFKKKNV